MAANRSVLLAIMTLPDEVQHLIQTDVPLAPRTSLGIGGPARFFAEPPEADDLPTLVRAARGSELPVRVLGGGSNVLVRESGVDGLVISLAAAVHSGLSMDGHTLRVGAGAKLSQAVVKAVGDGLAGLEHLIGIPGTVGGAVVGNVSAGGRDIGSVVSAVEVMNLEGDCESIGRDDLHFGHRKSSLGDRPILAVHFQLEPADVTTLTKRMQKLWISRNAKGGRASQNRVMPFADPDGMPIGQLFQTLGLAGLRQGGAAIDSSQPEYLVAESDATSSDCLELISRVREQTLAQTDIDLQLNLQIW